MLSFWKNKFFEQSLKLEQELRDRLASEKASCQVLRDENLALRAKIERMELVLMPLSSRAGAAFVAAQTPRPPRDPATMVKVDEPTGWQAVLNKFMKDEEDKAKKEQANVPS